MFIKLSQLTRWPLNVSPFLSSTNCVEERETEDTSGMGECFWVHLTIGLF